MSIIHSYDPERVAVINPENVRKKHSRKLDVCIINFSYKIMDALLDDGLLELVSADTVKTVSCVYPVYACKGSNIGVVKTTVGAPITAALIEEIGCAFSCTRFVMFGACGGLDKDLTYGRLIVPTHAYRDEGVSYHYLPESDYIEIPNHVAVGKVLDRLSIPYVKGRTWTTDAIFRETRGNMARRKVEGCIAVEMEVSACQAVAGYRGYQFYNFLYSADNLDHAQWDQGILSKISLDERLRHFFIALEIAKYVSKENDKDE